VIMNTPGIIGFVGIGGKPMAFTATDWTDLPMDPFRKQ
jgi:transcription antitermination factor NusG